MNILESYVCLNPFNYIEVHKEHVYTCCPSWLNTPIGHRNSLEGIEDSEILKKIQQSVMDGTYSYCNKTLCPYLSELIHNDRPFDVIVSKTQENNYVRGRRVSLCFDQSCNLSCPSCRNEFFMENEESIKHIEKTLDDIKKNFGTTVKSMSISGTSDPFASKTLRNFLINFDKKDFPKLSSIYLQTNGLLLTEKMWNNISNVHKIIDTIAVSIDAATSETYNIVRRGGNFEKLLENLKFISTLPQYKSFSFVVQNTNYKEMKMFYDLILSLKPKGKFDIYFSKINNWGTFTEEDFKNKAIYDENHIFFQDFLVELEKISFKHNVYTNMNDIIKKYINKKKTLI